MRPEDCVPAFIGLEKVGVLTAPQELEIVFVADKTIFRTHASGVCPERMDGGVVKAIAIASDVRW
jgi:hypothetical protein